MSTRCHVIVKGSENEPQDQWAYIYHHHDGYPEGVGKDLGKAFEEKIKSNVLGHKYTWENVIEIITNIDDEYEVDNGIHGDEEYLYVVTLERDKEGVCVDCYKILPFSFKRDSDKFTMDEGYEFIYQKVYRNTSWGVMNEKQEKDFMEYFNKELHTMHNIHLLEMLRAICDELTLRETE